MIFFNAAFYGLCAICAAILYVQNTGTGNNIQTTADFKKFQRIYLLVYITAVMGDWLQGPYVYALYTMYQFSKAQIGVLFIVGFGSSAVFGPFAGTWADKYGRKISCIAYCVLYIFSCMTKHSPNFEVLLIGRLTGGMATSILFSSFESWLVAEHNKHFFPSEWLNQTFQFATIGNGITAIVAGWLGSLVRDSFDSLVAPFDAAILFLIICMAVIVTQWSENKGEASALPNSRVDGRSKLQIAMDTMKKDKKVFLLGMIQSCFEGAMYIFVFMWTPKLEPLFMDKETSKTILPHGQVFGCFMACCMVGSCCVKYLMQWRSPAHRYMREIYILAAFSLMLPALGFLDGYSTMLFFFLFEWVCGVYFPTMGMIKSKYVAEEVRATVYNIFRIPLNIIVVSVLANIKTVSDNTVFMIAGFLLLAAAFMQHVFSQMAKADDARGDSMGQAAAAATQELSHLELEEEGDGSKAG
jgi:MFS family permease